MKILLLGEFSALHKNLKEGLISLGHEVDIASSGDGWKNISRDIDLSVKGNYITQKIKHVINLFKLTQLVKNYDVVQLMNPFIFYNKLIPNTFFYKKLIQNSKKFYLLGAGDDAYFWANGRKKLKYGPFDDFLKYDMNNANGFFMENQRAFQVNKFIADNCDGIIPIMFEYETSYDKHPNLKKTIPIPINIEKIEYKENKIIGKIVVFHGLNRYGFKGTRHVEEAFKILEKKYPNDLELIIDGNMPLEKYLEVMRKTNIVIDQTNSYSLGVNGIYALSMGKVVLGGVEPESLKSLEVENSPAINIKPNAQSIVEEIEKLLEKKEQLRDIGLQSRKFAKETHSHIKIAKKYLKAWGVE